MSDTSIDTRSGALGAVLDGPQVSDYWELLKPRVMSLVVFTGFAGLFVAPGHLNPILATEKIDCYSISVLYCSDNPWVGWAACSQSKPQERLKSARHWTGRSALPE